MSRPFAFLLASVVALSPTTSLVADDESAALQAIVEQAAEHYVRAFAERDAAAVAKLFTAEAEYVDSSGIVFHGRGAIEAEVAAAFAVRPAGSIDVEFVSIRPISEGVLVEEGVSTFTPAEGVEAVATRTRYSVTHVKQSDGSWLMASVRELEPASVTPHDRLQSLAWLVGDWSEEVDGNLITTSWKWSKEGNFLVSEFAVQQSRDESSEGTHRIGWDAERKQFRSWIFDATGGAADGWWRLNEDGTWTVSLTRVDADGVRSSSLLSYAADGKDTIVVSRDQVVHGGVSEPGSVHRIVRRPPAPEAASAR